MNGPTTAYRKQLDALRALAVTAVLYQHFWDPGSDSVGRLGVRLFFVISGYLITGLLIDARNEDGRWPRAALKNFYLRRALRIVPAYYFALAAAFALNLEGVRETIWWHVLFATNALFAIQGSWDPWPTAHLWTLSIELQFYLLWPMLVLPMPVRLMPAVFSFLIVAAVVFRWFFAGSDPSDATAWVLTPAAFDALGAGALIQALERTGCLEGRSRAIIELAGAVAAIYIAGGLVFGLPYALDYVSGQFLMIAAGAALVAKTVRGVGGLPGAILNFAPLRALGRISYGLYLYHLFVLALMFDVFERFGWPALQPGPFRFFLFGALSIAVALASWRWVEKPVLRLKSRLTHQAR
jgi:peptidoglycan/LPS O-acetylase OafA/YrhL